MILKGTKFQIKVWKYLKTFKKCNVLTYSDVAQGIQKPTAGRSRANAIGKNPYDPKIKKITTKLKEDK